MELPAEITPLDHGRNHGVLLCPSPDHGRDAKHAITSQLPHFDIKTHLITLTKLGFSPDKPNFEFTKFLPKIRFNSRVYQEFLIDLTIT